MTQQEVLDKLQPIFRDVMDDESITVTRQSSANNVPNWDSLSHINLISAIEHDFKVKFALGELQDLKNVGDLVDLILKKKSF
jgi:acyl carrier protein